MTEIKKYYQQNKILLIFLGNCGYNKLSKSISAFIVGGEISSRGKWPWLAAIYLYGEHHCGATLIHPQYLVTAAHCLFDGGFYKEKEDLHIVLNDFKR